MSELLNQMQRQWAYALGLVVAFPLLLEVLSELAFALARAGHPVAASVRFVRTWVVPLVALSLFFRWVVLLPATSFGVRLAETLCWAAVIVAIMGVVNKLVFESARPGSWQGKVPRLLHESRFQVWTRKRLPAGMQIQLRRAVPLLDAAAAAKNIKMIDSYTSPFCLASTTVK